MQHPEKPLAIMANAATNIIERMVHILVLRDSGSVRVCLGTVPGQSTFLGWASGRHWGAGDTQVIAGKMTGEIVERAITDRIGTSFIVVTIRRIEQKKPLAWGVAQVLAEFDGWQKCDLVTDQNLCHLLAIPADSDES